MLNIENYQTKSGYSGLTKLLNRLLKDKNLNQNIKKQINQIYFDNFIKENNLTLNETIYKLNNIKIKCKICNIEYSLFDICPNEKEINKFKNRNGLYSFSEDFINKDYEENEYIKKHVDYVLDIQKKRILLNNIVKIYNNNKKLNDWSENIYNYLEKEIGNFDYSKSYEELYNIFNIEVCKCKICKTPLYFFNQNCPNIGTKQGENGKYSVVDKDLNECNEKEILHIKYRQNASSYGAWETKKKLMSENKEYDKKMRDTSKLNTEESHEKSKKSLQNHIQDDPEWWNSVNEAKIKTRNENGNDEICNLNLNKYNQIMNKENEDFIKTLPGKWKNLNFSYLYNLAFKNNIQDNLYVDYVIKENYIDIVNLSNKIEEPNNEIKKKYFHHRRKILQYIYNKTICLECGKQLNNINLEFCCEDCKNKYFNLNTKYLIIFKDENNNLKIKSDYLKNILINLNNRKYKIENLPGFNIRWCYYCNKLEYHYNNKCLKCFNNNQIANNKLEERNGIKYWYNEQVCQIIKKIELGEYDLKYFHGWNIRYCKKCEKYEYHLNDICLICNEENDLKIKFKIDENGIRRYNNEPCKIIEEEILSGIRDINDYNGFNNRFDHICYGSVDITTGKEYKLNKSNIENVDGIDYIYNNEIGEWQKLDIFYENYNNQKKNINPNDEIQKLIKEENFSIEMIVNIDNDTWSRNKTNSLLCKNGYGWICYIKLLNKYPWIVGKTGTTNVSKSPIDFDFIIKDVNNPNNQNYNGSGRRYAQKYYPNLIYSDHEYVLCKNFETEEEALQFERYIADKYNLFES